MAHNNLALVKRLSILDPASKLLSANIKIHTDSSSNSSIHQVMACAHQQLVASAQLPVVGEVLLGGYAGAQPRRRAPLSLVSPPYLRRGAARQRLTQHVHIGVVRVPRHCVVLERKSRLGGGLTTVLGEY